jgi:hypothetical protein
MSQRKAQNIVQDLYILVKQLEELFPGRHFTPDGHLVGSIGECLVAEMYGLELMPASNKGYDATDPKGRKIEIKATQARSVGFRSEPDYCIVVKLNPDGTITEVFNGPGSAFWPELSKKKRPSNGQYQISLSRLGELQKAVKDSHRAT